jgi:thiol-disulfide isomerase/thioredoxin
MDADYTGKVFLAYAANDSSNVLDSTVAQKGSFRFTGSIAGPREAILHLGKGTAIGWVYLDTGTITLTAKRFTTLQNGQSITGLEVLSVTGSYSDSLKRTFSKRWQAIMGTTAADSSKAQQLFTAMKDFVRRYPEHDLSSSFLSEAAMLGQLNYQQALTIFELLGKQQKTKAGSNGVEMGLAMLNKTGIGVPYAFIPQPDTLGHLISGRELKYDYLLIDFWASWCKPCREEHPRLLLLHDQYKGGKLAILSVSLDTDRGDWLKAIRQDKLTWTQVSDLKGTTQNALAKYYNIGFIPFNILVGKDGKILATNIKSDALRGYLE